EESAALREERLERREVDLRGIHLDLPEIRVDREVEREVAGETVLRVGAEVVAARAERIAGGEIEALVARHRVGKQLEPALSRETAEAGEMPVAAHAALLLLGREREVGGLALPEDRSRELEAPGRLLLRVVAELGERDAQLRAPSRRVDVGVGLPDRVPRVVLVAV